MQLKHHAVIRGALAAAATTALNGTAHAVQPVDSWKVDSAVLYYTEQDRVSVTEPVIYATKQVSEDKSYTLRFVYDSMTGATPNGAAPSSQPQTITSASGGSTLTIAPGELPKKDFSDQRYALGIDWEKNTSRLVKRSSSFNISKETDYFSLGGNRSYSRDSENRMRTYTAGAGVSFDLVSPEGGAPVGLQSINVPRGDDGGGDDGGGGEGENDLFSGERKTTIDFLIGTTQILSRRSLLQINLAHSLLNGYLTDPYKMLSVVDSNGLPVDYVWEKRPDRRNANILYAKWVYHLPKDVIHLSYRYFQDDWGIRSHTSDLTYHLMLPKQLYLEPHLRYYTQTKADFYHSSLLNTAPLPDYASADYRLAEMNSRTVGVKLGIPVGSDSEVNFRYEKMVQRGDSHPADAIGTQRSLDLYPGLDVTIMQISYYTLF